MQAINREVEKVSEAQDKPCKRRSTTHFHYHAEIRAKIGKYAAENGNKNTTEKFSGELLKPVNESTVRGFKKAYYLELKKGNDPDEILELKHGLRGKPKKLGDLDQNVQKYVRKLCAARTPVNCSIVIAAARGVVQHHSPSLLTEHGGNLELGRKWAESFMSRMG